MNKHSRLSNNLNNTFWPHSQTLQLRLLNKIAFVSFHRIIYDRSVILRFPFDAYWVCLYWKLHRDFSEEWKLTSLLKQTTRWSVALFRAINNSLNWFIPMQFQNLMNEWFKLSIHGNETIKSVYCCFETCNRFSAMFQNESFLSFW